MDSYSFRVPSDRSILSPWMLKPVRRINWKEMVDVVGSGLLRSVEVAIGLLHYPLAPLAL